MEWLSNLFSRSFFRHLLFWKKSSVGGEKKSPFKPISFATDKRGVYILVSMLILLTVSAAIPFSVALLENSQDIRTAASGTFVGSKVFCQGRNLCPDGRCEGDSWKECTDCPIGKARMVTQIQCDQYKRSQCYFECD